MTSSINIGDILTVTKNSIKELGIMLNVISPHINCNAILPFNNIPKNKDTIYNYKNFIVKIINIQESETNTNIIVTRLNISKKDKKIYKKVRFEDTELTLSKIKKSYDEHNDEYELLWDYNNDDTKEYALEIIEEVFNDSYSSYKKNKEIIRSHMFNENLFNELKHIRTLYNLNISNISFNIIKLLCKNKYRQEYLDTYKNKINVMKKWMKKDISNTITVQTELLKNIDYSIHKNQV